MDEVPVGRVTHYFPKIQVAAVDLHSDELRLGDSIRVLGATSNFTQAVHSMEIAHNPIERARTGEMVAIQVTERARVGDLVFRILPHTHIDGLSIGQEGTGP
jgi:putative protease